MIKILKASAGSGKTYRLAKEYLELILREKNPEAYRHILAVTFTNKATAEMKQRILKELDILAREPQESDYFDDFCPRLFPDPVSLRNAARERLAAILHDYSAFSVSTIDAFFQRTLKAFSREIGHFASYQIELDRDALVSESVDRVLDSLSDGNTPESQALLEWLMGSVMQTLKEGNRYNLDRGIREIADSLLRESFREKVRESGIDGSAVFDREHLQKLIGACSGKDGIIKKYEESVRKEAQAVLDLLKSHYGLDSSALGGSTKKIAALACPPGKGRIERPAPGFFPACADASKWLKKDYYKNKKDPSKEIRPEDLELVIGPSIEALVSLFDRPFQVYNTALTIMKQIHVLGIAAELRQTFTDIQQEKNILGLDESTTLLRDIIDHSDAPFIYEKTGVWYDHFLLDEFQDTSRVQWSNFYPLLLNSHAAHQENLIVGDVKQSIYRWRDSDWNLLDSGVERSFSLAPGDTENMQDNWRTYPVIVETNNRFFRFAADQLDLLEGSSASEISTIYKDVWQRARKGEAEDGCVETVFCADRDTEMEEILRAVRTYQDMGWDFGDITILTRYNQDGEDVAKLLIENNIPVISDDALFVKASVTVRRLVSQLSLINAPSEEKEKDGRLSISGFLANTLQLTAWKEDDSYHNLSDLAEEILRELQAYDPDTYAAEIPYIQAFMDYLQDRVAIDGNDLPAFLLHWKDAKPKIAPPESGHSVRILSIHKAKGLEFPCVILPFAERISLFYSEKEWCIPEKTEGTELEGVTDGIYRAQLSEKSKDTLFEASYLKERHLQLIDNLNILYVAMTRPIGNLRIIGELPSEKTMEQLPESFNLADCLKKLTEEGIRETAPLAKWTDMSELLYAFAHFGMMTPSGAPGEELRFRKGELVTPARKAALDKKKGKEEVILPITSVYPSYSLTVGEKNRLRFSKDAADFFGDDGTVGFEASPRVMGTVLHNILAQVAYPEEELEPAIIDAVRGGLLPVSRAEEIDRILSERIAGIRDSHPDWFPATDSGCRVLNETSILGDDGEFYRPDRMVVSADGRHVTIVDYKFGKRNPGAAEADREIRKYLRQIGRYAALMREMGYPEVEAHLWYPLAAPEEAVITLRPQA